MVFQGLERVEDTGRVAEEQRTAEDSTAAQGWKEVKADINKE